MTFDPNAAYKQVQQPGWATYIKARSPKFKVHTKIGAAKNALNVKYPHSSGIIYEWMNGAWIEWDKSVIPTACNWCDTRFTAGTFGPHTVSLAKIGYKTPLVCDHCYKGFSAYESGLTVSELKAHIDQLYQKCGVERHAKA